LQRKAKMKEMWDVLSTELSLSLHLDNQNAEVSPPTTEMNVLFCARGRHITLRVRINIPAALL
jgi:hypothetical protein